MNLITNGAEAIDSEGIITITTQNIKVTKHQENSRLKEGSYILLSISDNGHGIPEKDISSIFEPFYTKKKMGRSGTGLGLAIVWNTIQDHHGNITVQSDSHGTSFNLYFPATDEAHSMPQIAESTILDLQGDQQQILVVDDEKNQREIAYEILKNLNYRPTCIESGEKALKYIETHTPDLIILDMLMGTGINGLTTYKRILQKYPDQKVIVASGYAENDLIQKTKNLGVEQFMSKPYTIIQLGEAIKNTLTAQH
jgi:CheY-like chemotaxis protein